MDNESVKAAIVFSQILGGGGSDPDAVKYTEQSKTKQEKTQARANIEAEEKHPYTSLVRRDEYLCDISFNDIPEYKEESNIPSGSCTSFVRDGKLYRNLDWKYDNTMSFHVTCKDFEGMSFINGLTNTSLDNELLGQLPYHLVDGINKHGIMVSTHIIFNDFEWTGTGDTPVTILPYLVLTNVKSMSTIQDDLAEILSNLKITPAMQSVDYLIQVLVTDGTTTYVLQPNNSNEYEAVNITSNPKLTNFEWVNSETVVRTDLQDRPTGVERWNAVSSSTLEDLRFTKAYESPSRLSEFIGINETTKDSTDEELTEIYNIAHAMYQTRERNGELWQTVHSVVYSPNRMEHLWIQENWDKDFICYSELPVEDVTLNDISIVQDKVAKIVAALEISGTPVDTKLVTEKTIYDYIASGNDGKPRALDGANLNNVEATGFYACNVCTNRPTENNGAMIVIKNTVNVTTLVQIYFSFVADEMWVRHKDNGIWKDWVKVLKSGANSTDIAYDNTTSGLSSTNVKGALDEISSNESTAVHYTVDTGKSVAQKDTARKNIDAAIEEPHPYAYDGVNLKEFFGNATALHQALAAENYSHIHNGDYYPITVNGSYRDYGEWVALAGTKYYSDTTLKTEAGTLDEDVVTTYVDASPAYYDITISGTVYHVKMQDCQRYREKTINQNAKMEVNINPYWRYGDSGVLTGNKPHICWISRDGIGNFKMRSTNQQWADAMEDFYTGDGSTTVYEATDTTYKCVRYVCVDGALQTYNTAYTVDTSNGKVTFKSGYIPADGADIIISRTTHDNPWTGSAIYKTLNDQEHGIMRLITDTEFASHILDNMRYYGETRTVANSTSVAAFNRGKGFLPTESEVWGVEVYSTRGNYSNLPQLPIFAKGGRRHISKGSTDGASRYHWWVVSSGSTLGFCVVSGSGYAFNNGARVASALVLGFITT